MALAYPLIDVMDVEAFTPPGRKGWPESALRVAVSGREGSSSSAYHARFRPGEGLPRHINAGCDEILIHLQGEGVTRGAAVRPGHCRWVKKGTEHEFRNTGDTDALVVGFYVGAKDINATGYEFLNEGTEKNTTHTPRTGLVHLDDVPPETMNKGDGWLISDFRLPFGAHNGCASTLFRARFFPGAVHKKHRHENCEEIYYVISGHGLAGAGDDRVEVRGGHFHYIPKGVEHWLHNLSETEPIEVVGIYINSGSVAETGYVYTGDVTDDDLSCVSELPKC
ncbi:MAG: cupin domain-containing protein [Rhodospirillales bacterium]|nr:cupin domain-containing protein [Rhodospirillales bacterium]